MFPADIFNHSHKNIMFYFTIHVHNTMRTHLCNFDGLPHSLFKANHSLINPQCNMSLKQTVAASQLELLLHATRSCGRDLRYNLEAS